MRSSIRKRLLLSTSLIVGLSLLISGVMVYQMLHGELIGQAMEGNQEKLRLFSQQIENLLEDIRTLSRHIQVDPLVQNYIAESGDRSVGATHALSMKLRDYLAFQDYAHSVALIDCEGGVYWSQAPYDTNYFAQELKEPWYEDTGHTDTNVFSSVHQILWGALRASNVTSYITPVRSTSSYSAVQGQLILNININYFGRALVAAAETFDGIMLVDQQGHAILSAGNADAIMPILSLDQDTIQIDGGYVVTEHLDCGWRALAFNNQAVYQPRQRVFLTYYLLFALIALVLILLIMLPFQMSITRPLQTLSQAMRRVSDGEIETISEVHSRDEIELLSDVFNSMLQDIRTYIDEAIHSENEKNNLKFELMLAQINPHFIYNTLNTVIYLANQHGDAQIEELVHSFIRVLRDNVRLGDEGQWNTVEKEIVMIRHYIDLMRFRFPAPIDIQWEIDNAILQALIPRALIQPIVENALYHGLINKGGPGTLIIRAMKIDDGLLIEVEDDGIGMEEVMADQLLHPVRSQDGVHRIGLYNVKSRLDILYGEQYSMNIDSASMRGTRFTICLNHCVES